MTNQIGDKNQGLTILDKEQQAAKLRKRTEKFIQVLKLLIRIGGMLISFWIFFFNQQKDVPNIVELKKNRYCSAGDGDFYPHTIMDTDNPLWPSPKELFDNVSLYYLGMFGKDDYSRPNANRTNVQLMLDKADAATSGDKYRRMILKSTGSAIQMEPEFDDNGK